MSVCACLWLFQAPLPLKLFVAYIKFRLRAPRLSACFVFGVGTVLSWRSAVHIRSRRGAAFCVGDFRSRSSRVCVGCLCLGCVTGVVLGGGVVPGDYISPAVRPPAGQGRAAPPLRWAKLGCVYVVAS